MVKLNINVNYYETYFWDYVFCICSIIVGCLKLKMMAKGMRCLTGGVCLADKCFRAVPWYGNYCHAYHRPSVARTAHDHGTKMCSLEPSKKASWPPSHLKLFIMSSVSFREPARETFAWTLYKSVTIPHSLVILVIWNWPVH